MIDSLYQLSRANKSRQLGLLLLDPHWLPATIEADNNVHPLLDLRPGSLTWRLDALEAGATHLSRRSEHLHFSPTTVIEAATALVFILRARERVLVSFSWLCFLFECLPPNPRNTKLHPPPRPEEITPKLLWIAVGKDPFNEPSGMNYRNPTLHHITFFIQSRRSLLWYWGIRSWLPHFSILEISIEIRWQYLDAGYHGLGGGVCRSTEIVKRLCARLDGNRLWAQGLGYGVWQSVGASCWATTIEWCDNRGICASRSDICSQDCGTVFCILSDVGDFVDLISTGTAAKVFSLSNHSRGWELWLARYVVSSSRQWWTCCAMTEI